MGRPRFDAGLGAGCGMKPLRVVLGDGRAAVIRPVSERDAPEMQALVRGLSWRTRIERFFMPVAELSPRQLERVLGGNGLSLGAFDDRGAMVAHALYVPEARGEAEFGIVVDDAWQQHGLGARMMAELLDHARNAGVAAFSGIALSDNGRMRRLARKLGFAFKRDDDPQLVRMERWLGTPA
jgi:RimJ/RimL family protein N-acetyltransferase